MNTTNLNKQIKKLLDDKRRIVHRGCIEHRTERSAIIVTVSVQ